MDANSGRPADPPHLGTTRADPSAERVPELASAWEFVTPTTVVFHLRRDFHFPDGRQVSAADVKATYDAVLDPALSSPKRAALAMLAGVEAPDATTVVMR